MSLIKLDTLLAKNRNFTIKIVIQGLTFEKLLQLVNKEAIESCSRHLMFIMAVCGKQGQQRSNRLEMTRNQTGNLVKNNYHSMVSNGQCLRVMSQTVLSTFSVKSNNAKLYLIWVPQMNEGIILNRKQEVRLFGMSCSGLKHKSCQYRDLQFLHIKQHD